MLKYEAVFRIPFILMQIRIRPKIEQIPIFFFLIFFCKRFKLITMFFVVVILSLLFTYKQNKWFLKLYSYNFGRFVCEFITIFLLPGSGSTFPEVDPDPAQWYESHRIQINTRFLNSRNECILVQNKVGRSWLVLKDYEFWATNSHYVSYYRN